MIFLTIIWLLAIVWAKNDKTRTDVFCQDDLPNLKVGDIQLNSNNFNKFKKDNKLFVLGISDSDCDDCCSSEPLLRDLQ